MSVDNTIFDDLPESPVDLALTLAERGLFVFPCRHSDEGERKSKSPLTSKGVHDATRRENIIRGWFGKWPEALVAIDLKRSALAVLDIDTEESHGPGTDGFMAIAFLSEHGIEPPVSSLAVATPGNGVHMYFAHPGDGVSSQSMPGGLDLKTRGYTIAPGSRLRDGRRYIVQYSGNDAKEGYRALCEELREIYDKALIPAEERGAVPSLNRWLALPELPEWCRDGRGKRILEKRFGKKTGNLEGLVDPTPPAGTAFHSAYATTALTRECERVAAAPKGSRNATLNEAAFATGTLVGAGALTRSEVEHALISAAGQCGLLSEDSRAVRATIASGLQAGIAKPRTLPDPIALEPKSNASTSSATPAPAVAAHVSWDGDEPPPPPRWRIKGLLPETGVAFLSGEWGAGKSFLAIDIALSIAIGESFFGKKTMPGGVFYYAAESEADIPVRIEAAKRGKFNVALSARSMAGQAVSDRLPIAWASDIPPLNTSEGLRKIMATAADVADALKRRGSAGLSTIIIDTLSAAFSVEDEQSNAEAAKIVKVLKHIADETGTLVLTIAHHGKDAGRGVRGASAYSANVDTILAITGDVNTTTGAVSNRRLSLTKTKRAERGWNCRFDLKIEPLGTDEDGDLISSCYVEAFTELEPSQPATRPLPESAFILLRALDEVLSSGKTHDLQVRGDGPNIKAVELRSVRREFDRLYVTGDDDKRSRSAKNTQWKRGLTRIQDDRIVGCETAGNVELIWKA